jgi:hypothetical protein
MKSAMSLYLSMGPRGGARRWSKRSYGFRKESRLPAFAEGFGGHGKPLPPESLYFSILQFDI